MLSEEAPEEQEATVCCEREQVRRYGVSPQDRNKKKKTQNKLSQKSTKRQNKCITNKTFHWVIIHLSGQ